MSYSLALRFLIGIVLIGCVLIGSNRYLAKVYISQQTQSALHENMQRALERCGQKIESPDAFLVCARANAKDRLVRSLFDGFLLCRQGRSTQGPESDALCALNLENAAYWTHGKQLGGKDAQIVINTRGAQTWHSARLMTQEDIQIHLSAQDLQAYLQNIWDLRDRNLIYVLPMLAVMMLVSTALMVGWMLRPFEALTGYMNQLSPDNLAQHRNITTRVKEFQPFIFAYRELCDRLSSGFTKAKRFSSDASHELRTPLTILRGHSEALIAGAPTGSLLQVSLRSMADEIERLIDITEKLLLLSKVESQAFAQELVEFNIGQFFDQLAQDSLLYHPNLMIEKSIDSHLMWRCNQSLVKQLIHNLYSNAVKYNIPGGWVKFTLRSESDALELALENPASSISEDLSQKAFDRFYRGDAAHNREVDGIGLGLSICKEIAALHHGTLALEVTKACTVIVRLRASLHRAGTA